MPRLKNCHERLLVIHLLPDWGALGEAKGLLKMENEK